MKNTSNEVRKTIEKAKSIAIFGHMNPDGDCIWSMLGLWKLLEKQGKRVKYFVPNAPSKIFSFLKKINRLKSRFDYKTYDLLLFVDFSSIERMGIIYQANPEYFKDKNIVAFDHHLEENIPNGSIIKDTHSISACEVIFEETHKRWPSQYDKEIATYFYMGITSDSANFLFGENHIRTFENAVKLLKLWADKDFVVDNLMRKKSFDAIKFLQLLLNRIRQNWDIIYTYYQEDELQTYNIDSEEAAYALHIIQNIDGPKIMVLMRKTENMIKWSLRAKKIQGKIKIDCNAIAKTLWWWGHKLAAGFNVPIDGIFEQQVEDIIHHIKKYI